MSDLPSNQPLPHQANDGLLRTALKANAALSLTTGVILIIAAGPLAAWMSPLAEALFGLSTVALLRLTGIELLVFAALPFWVSRQARLSIPLTRLVIALDLLWIAGSAALILVLPQALTTGGVWVVGLSALLVLDFVLLQGFGLWQLYQGRAAVALRHEGRDLHIHAANLVDAPPEVVWRVMADQEGYADVADNIGKVQVLEGSGLGMIRQCSDTAGRSWRERCTFWEEGRAFTFVVDTEAADYPYPLEYLQGRWSMTPVGDLVSVEMDFIVRPKPGPMNGLLFRMLLGMLLPVCDRLLASWATRMQGETVAAWARPEPRKPELRKPGLRKTA
ncbi:type II toxin-antitoxin system RatA family toxin [Pelagibius sp.]|uniref:type II toxin-antitoxin system RatA family toxin n=1 Tax=Pelagibius sp. TaxID=1931238 RepID=UPI003BAE64A0